MVGDGRPCRRATGIPSLEPSELGLYRLRIIFDDGRELNSEGSRAGVHGRGGRGGEERLAVGEERQATRWPFIGDVSRRRHVSFPAGNDGAAGRRGKRTRWVAPLDAPARQAGPRRKMCPRPDANRRFRTIWVAGLRRPAGDALRVRLSPKYFQSIHRIPMAYRKTMV